MSHFSILVLLLGLVANTIGDGSVEIVVPPGASIVQGGSLDGTTNSGSVIGGTLAGAVADPGNNPNTNLPDLVIDILESPNSRPDEPRNRGRVKLGNNEILTADYNPSDGSVDYETAILMGYSVTDLVKMAENGVALDPTNWLLNTDGDVFQNSRNSWGQNERPGGIPISVEDEKALLTLSIHAENIRKRLLAKTKSQLLLDNDDCTPNGCTASPDFNFGDACNAHDYCYCNACESRGLCDLNLFSGIENRAGEALAYTYWSAVVTFGGLFYESGSCSGGCTPADKYTKWGDYNAGNVGKPCVFPFKVSGTTYNDCVWGGQYYQYWCATQVDANEEMIAGKWGHCNECGVCPGHVTDDGGCCDTQFYYDGSWRTKVWSWVRWDYWCATLTDGSGNYVDGWWDWW